MKFTRFRKAALLALAGMGLLTTTARAANTYNPGDLLLGVRASGGVGLTQEVIVNLGSITQFVETNSATITVGPNVKTILDNTFGVAWPTRSDVHFSVSGTTGLSDVGGFGPKTLWATNARSGGAPATPWERQSETGQGFTMTKMSALATTYVNGTLTSGAMIQAAANTNSYSSYMPGGTVVNSGGTSFASFNPSIEGNPEQALDLFRMVYGSGAGPYGPGTYVGRFSLLSNGNVVFTPRDGSGGAFTTVALQQSTYSVSHTVGNVDVKIVRTGDPLTAFNATANTADGTAEDGTHYTGVANQVVSFAANETEKTLSIPIIEQEGSQPLRSFTTTISGPTASVVLGTPASATVNIAESGPAEYTLEIASHTVAEGGTLAVKVKRVGNTTVAGSVDVFATPNSAATPADFAFPSQPISFGIGETEKVVPVSITTVGDSLTTETNEFFTVRLQNPLPADTTTLGDPNTWVVSIVEATAPTTDTSKPAINLSTPLANALIPSSSLQVTFTGTVTDNKGVQSLEYRATTPGAQPSAWTPATVFTPGAPSSGFTAVVSAAPGINNVEFRARDFKAPTPNELIVARSFVSLRPLEITVDGTGTLTTGFANSPDKEPGKSYSVTATPGAGNIFTNWEIVSAHQPSDIGIAASSLEKPTLTFIFREGLKLKAVIVDNPFDTGAAGSYNGLITASLDLPDRPIPEDDGTLSSNSTEGLFKATVMATGAFSGTLTIDGLVLNVAGTFDHLGRARFGTARALTVTVARTGKPSLVAQFDAALVAPYKITGTVTATDFKKSSLPVGVSEVEADRAYYTGLTQPLTVPDEYLTVTGTATSPTGRSDAKFTVVFPARPALVQPSGLTETDYPQGDGVGSVTVSKTGTITVAGTLADGTAISASTALSQGNDFPLFVPLYNKLGFLAGKVTLDHNEPESDMSAEDDLKWSRPFMTTQQWYAYGWPEVISVGMDGAKYRNIAGTSVLKGANGIDLDATDEDGNADLQFSLGLLTAPIDRSVNIAINNAVTKVPSNDPTFTMAITPTTGMVTGTFIHEDDTKPAYQAVIYQKGVNAGAYGFFLTAKPVVLDYLGESGWVTLFAQ